MNINIYAIPNFIVAFYTFFISIFVFLKNKHSKINILFALLCFCAFGYLFSYALLYQFPIKLIIYWAPRIGHTFTLFLGPFYYHFCISYLKKEEKILPLFLYIVVIFLSFFVFNSTLYFKDVTLRYWGYFPKGGILALLELFIIHAIIGARCIFLLIKQLKIEKATHNFIEYNRLKYLTFALGVFLFTSLDYIPKFVLDFYPIGFVTIAIFLYLSTYCIIKHNLLDINIVFRKGTVYSILISIITTIYFILAYLAENLFRGFIGYKSIPLTLVMIIFFILLFQPLKNKIQLFVDKYFFKATHEMLVIENERLMEEIRRTDRLKAVATLAAGMAHEIKNPLTGIKTFTEYLDTRYTDENFRNKFKRIVGNEVDKINTIVGQLLDFAKPKPLSLQKIDIHKLLDETLSLLSSDLIKKRIDIAKEYNAKEAKTIKADSNRLKQAFLNLFLNAMDAMKNGGKLIISTKQSNETGSLEITIQDTGKGIPKKNLSHIFDPFYSTKESGTGLGLSIVHGIIKEHGGNITCESEENKGAKFIITLAV